MVSADKVIEVHKYMLEDGQLNGHPFWLDCRAHKASKFIKQGRTADQDGRKA